VIQPTALNFVIVALMVVLFAFMWRLGSASLLDRNPDSGLGKGMAAIFS